MKSSAKSAPLSVKTMRWLIRGPVASSAVELPRVPDVYLTWANPVFLAFFSFNGINNLRVFSVTFSSIPTAPSDFQSYLRRLMPVAFANFCGSPLPELPR